MNMQTVKIATGIALGIIVGFALLFQYVGWIVKNDQAAMSTEYCWDDAGNHYLSGDLNCTH